MTVLIEPHRNRKGKKFFGFEGISEKSYVMILTYGPEKIGTGLFWDTPLLQNLGHLVSTSIFRIVNILSAGRFMTVLRRPPLN